MDADLLRLLACPDYRSAPLEAMEEELRCQRCARRFPIVDGIPSLLPRALAGAMVGRDEGAARALEIQLSDARARDEESAAYDDL